MIVKITNTVNNEVILPQNDYQNVYFTAGVFDQELSVGEVTDTTTILNFMKRCKTDKPVLIEFGSGQNVLKVLCKIDSYKFNTEENKVYLVVNEIE